MQQIASPNNALHLTGQHSVSLRYTLCCPSAELRRWAHEGKGMRVLIALLLCVVCTSAYADYFSGNDLEQKLLQSNRMVDVSMFRGYVAGVQDVFNGVAFCVPEDVPLSQASAVVKKFLADNPRLWNEPAKLLVIKALKHAFPCVK